MVTVFCVEKGKAWKACVVRLEGKKGGTEERQVGGVTMEDRCDIYCTVTSEQYIFLSEE